MIIYILFYIMIAITIMTFIISLLWTYGYIRRKVLFEINGSKVTYRNIIDLSMIISRMILPLPFIPQPRFEVSTPIFIIGMGIYLTGIIFILLAVKEINAKLLYGKDINLITSGIYSIVRHPIYFGDSIWPLGWSIIFGGLYPALLTPLWFIFYILTINKEENILIRKYGEEYIEYRKRVKSIIPYIL